MKTRLFSLMDRHRLATLLLIVAVNLLLTWLDATTGDNRAIGLTVGGIRLAELALLFVLLVLAFGANRQPQFVVRPSSRAFAVGQLPQQFLTTALALMLNVNLLGQARSGFVEKAFLAVCLTLVIVMVVAVSCHTGLCLRPDGIYQRTLLGSILVPWAALPPGQPVRPALTANAVPMPFLSSPLVQRRGWWTPRRVLDSGRVHPWFLADALRYYGEHPEHRAAIGTPAEYQRLRAVLGADTTAVPASVG